MVQVFDGQAMVQQNDRTMELKKGRELALGGPWKVDSFRSQSRQPLKILCMPGAICAPSMRLRPACNPPGRSSWAEAPIGMDLVGIGIPTGSMYGFIPGDGIWYSPFGWPFYSPWVVGYGYGFGYGLRGYGHGFVATGHGHVSASAIASERTFRWFSAHGRRIRRYAGFAGGMHGGFGGGGIAS